MKKQIYDTTAMFLNVLKWILLSTGLGIIVGFTTSLFIKSLNPHYARKFYWISYLADYPRVTRFSILT